MNFFDKFQIYIYITIAALLSWWLTHLYELHVEQVKIIENSPDFFSVGYYKKEMNLEGLPKSELAADKMQHFKIDGATHLEKPVMTLYNAEKAPWVIKADVGLMNADNDNLQLNGSAIIHRDASESNDALTVNTSNLRIKLSTHYAETDDWAEILTPPNKTAGTGMQVTFENPIHLKLLSKVKGRYELK